MHGVSKRVQRTAWVYRDGRGRLGLVVRAWELGQFYELYCTTGPCSLAQSVAWLLSCLGDTGFESRLGWPFVFISPHPHVCKL